MPGTKGAWTDYQIDNIIGTLLRVGVVMAAVVVFLGGVFYLKRHGLEFPDYRVFHGEPSDLCDVRGIVKEAAAFRGRGIIQLGLLLLIATPVTRVAFTVFAFALQRDRVYVIVTLIVLGVLLYSIMGGGQ